MQHELVTNCYAGTKSLDGIKKAIFVNDKNEEVIALRDDGTQADYVDWLMLDIFVKDESGEGE